MCIAANRFFFSKKKLTVVAHTEAGSCKQQTVESDIHSNSITLYISFTGPYRYTRSVLLCCHAAADPLINICIETHTPIVASNEQ